MNTATRVILCVALCLAVMPGTHATLRGTHHRALKKAAGVWADAGVHSATVTASKMADLGSGGKAGVDASATGTVSAKCTGPGCTADASVKVEAGARISQTADLGGGVHLTNYAQVNATADASVHGSVSNAGVTGSVEAHAGVSAGVRTTLETDDGKASLSAGVEAGVKADASATFDAGDTNGIPGVHAEANADAMVYAKSDAEAKVEVAPNTTMSATVFATVVEGAKANAKFNMDLGNGTIGGSVGAMVGSGASVSVTAKVDSDYGGATVKVGASAGLVGATDSVSVTVKDCTIKLEGTLAVGLDLGLFVGGSVSINPCEIVKAIENGFVQVFKDIGHFFESILEPQKLKAQEEAAKAAKWIQIMHVASKTPANADIFYLSLHKLPEFQKWMAFMETVATTTPDSDKKVLQQQYAPIFGKQFMDDIDSEYANLVNAGKRVNTRENKMERWCKVTQKYYGIRPFKSWGSLAPGNTRNTWDSYNCNTKINKIETAWCKKTRKDYGVVNKISWGKLKDQETKNTWNSYDCNTKAPTPSFWSSCYSNESCTFGDRDTCIRRQCQTKGLTYYGDYQDCGGWKFKGYCK